MTVANAQMATARAAPRCPGELTIEYTDRLSWSAHDAAVLDTLIEARPHVGVFLTRAWLSGLFAEPPAGSQPYIVAIREGGTLRGMVPIAIRRTLTHARVSLLGGSLGSDRVDLLAERGYEAACADRWLDWLEREFPRGYVLQLRDVPGDSPLWGAIGRAASEDPAGVMVVPHEVYALPHLSLDEPGDTGSTGGARASASSESITRHRRRLERNCHFRVETLTDVDDVQQAFDVLRRLLYQRWGSASALERPRLQRFHAHVLPLLLGEGRLRMVRMWGDMRPIAIYYGLASRAELGVPRPTGSRRWWGYYLAGYDRAWAGRIHLGRIALDTAIDLAAKEGADEFDFLKGPERVKYLWPVRERITVDADVYSRGFGPRLAWARRSARMTLAALVRSAREIPRAIR